MRIGELGRRAGVSARALRDYEQLDVDVNPITARDAGVMGMPTLSLYVDGRVVAQIVGAKPRAALMRAIEDHLPVRA